MRSPRIEGPPVLQPVTDSAAVVSVGNRDSIETPVNDSASDDGNPATPPMPVLVEGEDFGDEDGSSFELVDEVSPSKLDTKSDAASDAPPPLTNGLSAKEGGHDLDAPPVITSYTHDERVNGDHEEPVLEKFFRLFTPGAQSPPRKEALTEVLTAKPEPMEPPADSSEPPALTPAPPASTSEVTPAPTPASTPKRRRPYTPRRKTPAEDRSPSAKRARGKAGKAAGSAEKRNRGSSGKASGGGGGGSGVFDFDSESEQPAAPAKKRGPKPKSSEERPKAGARKGKDSARSCAAENRYLRSPYIISTAESDSIMSRFQVVNPAFRDAASVNVTDQPFKHAVKLPPHAGLAKSAWVCVFCGLGTSFANLGCLFGPYYIDFNKFTAHADLISIAKPAKHRDSSPVPAQAPPAVTSSTPASSDLKPVPVAAEEKEEKEKEKEEEAAEGQEEGGEARGRRRTNRRLSRSANNTTNHSSISSFRNSKARASQTLLAAKDVRRCSVDSDKAPANVKQVDIAAVFFSSSQKPPADKKEEAGAKVNGKEAGGRRRSDAKEKEEEKAKEPEPEEEQQQQQPVPEASPMPPAKGRRSKVQQRKGAKSTPEKAKPPKRSVGRPPKEKEQPPRPNNCQAKCSKPRERHPSDPQPPAEQGANTRIAANGEAWTHLECVLWASGTYLNGKQIVGLEDALSEALQTVCKVCKLRGAMVACVQRGCDRAFHYYCAIQDDCYLDYEQFCIYCSKHKKKNATSATSYWSESTVQTF